MLHFWDQVPVSQFIGTYVDDVFEKVRSTPTSLHCPVATLNSVSLYFNHEDVMLFCGCRE